jgi:hypothetical protein
MYDLTDCEQSWTCPIHRILIILGRGTLSSGIPIFLLEVHSRRVQMMVVTIRALRVAIRGLPHPKLVISFGGQQPRLRRDIHFFRYQSSGAAHRLLGIPGT